MPLLDGDYLFVGQKVLDTLLSDTEPGGLREQGNPPVKTIESRVRDEMKHYSKYELPLISVEVNGKREVPSPSSRILDKIFELNLLVLCRGGDREHELEQCKRISARVEKIVREQNQIGKQFQALPNLISGSEGVLLAWVSSTQFKDGIFEEGSSSKPEAIGEIKVEILVPCRMGI